MTAGSLRGHAAVVALSLWAVAAWSIATPGPVDRFGTPKGIDFAPSWVPGYLVSHGRPDLLYDNEAWREAFPRLFPATPGLLFLPNYPPQTALLFSPFGRLPFGRAVLAWTALSLGLYAWSIRALWRGSPALAGEGRTVAVVAAAWPALFLVVLNGQNTTLVLGCYTLAALAWQARRDFWMGVAFGLCAVKPHFAVVPGLVLLATRRWRAVGGMGLAVAAQVAVVAMALGFDVFAAYARTTLEMLHDTAPFEPKLWQAHGLRNALTLLLGRGPVATSVYAASFVIVLAITVRAWRDESGTRAGRFAVLTVASALLNPHLYGYDLVVLAPALMIAAEWSVAHAETADARRLGWVTAALMLAPLAAPLAALTRIQLSVPLLAWLGWELRRLTASSFVRRA